MNTLRRGRVPGPRLSQQRVVDDTGTSTRSVHAGTYEDPVTGAVGTPVFQTSTFTFTEDTYEAFDQGHIRDVPIYGRYGSPNQWVVQEKLASLENAESAVLFSSGMAAITTTLLALTNRGGHIVSSRDVYGGTFNLLREDMHQLGREVTFTDPVDIDAIRAAVRDNTQVLFFETLTNPLLKAAPLVELGRLAREKNLLLVVDGTFLPPVCLRALEHGAHIVIHSATKYLNGHSDVTAGVAAGPRKYVDRIWAQLLKFGGSLDAMMCFLLERGLKTLALRMRQHSESAVAIAEFLAGHSAVHRVHHPSRPDYPYTWLHEMRPDGFGGMVAFELGGGDEAALKLMDRLRIPVVATSLGGVESLISLPFNTSHSFLTERQRAEVGIAPGLVRFSVGIEDTSDLVTDLDQALSSL
ncbi:aminotransferase class I/II-fold pyridoxal phosphate-dependent enzyme [Streptomyces sp. NBC_01142]|uniref:trans-sulfuration enzyme family protein n=1 Tax=Streptomyces sp. NBC_01142 TaxID=2975865 RepID=UPI0022561C18|nr:aminotransferase class I/II-fold pyridoxal phosphate-dependent enzyme [Streptomyces sp. NBC_01142]MCX4820793.1 aminotransferase class I/II-fold pyridoxal phosphate-dependent enzyme [Streptomyces sp. NBC_01142]